MMDEKFIALYKDLRPGPEKEWLEEIIEMALALRQQINLRKSFEKSNNSS